MRQLRRNARQAALILGFTLLAGWPASAGGSNTCGDGTDGAKVEHIGKSVLWPPNHKYQPATIRASESGTHAVELKTFVTSDQADDIVGAGNTSDDVTPASTMATPNVATGNGSASQDYKLRAERSGTIKEGRKYFLHYDAWFDHNGNGEKDSGETCTGQFDVWTPHDCRQGACKG